LGRQLVKDASEEEGLREYKGKNSNELKKRAERPYGKKKPFFKTEGKPACYPLLQTGKRERNHGKKRGKKNKLPVASPHQVDRAGPRATGHEALRERKRRPQQGGGKENPTPDLKRKRRAVKSTAD